MLGLSRTRDPGKFLEVRDSATHRLVAIHFCFRVKAEAVRRPDTGYPFHVKAEVGGVLDLPPVRRPGLSAPTTHEILRRR